jgi:hypothetical protein
MNKKIAVHIADNSGVTFHRLATKFTYMGDNHNDIDIFIFYDVDDISDFNEFDYVIFNRHIDKKSGNSIELVNKIRNTRCKIILDMDDHYQLHRTHLMYEDYDHYKKDVIYSIKNADYIIVTHQHMLNTFSKDFNISKSKFFISPNSIDTTQSQFQPLDNYIQDRIRFGWSGSVTHFDDILLMYDSIYQLYVGEHKDNIEILYGGYVKDDKVSEAMLGVLSGKGRADIDQFNIYPSTSILEYANFYKLINVGLIPLVDTEFNKMKSNLKLLEIGAHKKGLICQNIHPYDDILTDKNCIKINKKREWYWAFDKYIKNPNMIIDHGEQLFEDVQKYNIDVVVNDLYQFLKNLN